MQNTSVQWHQSKDRDIWEKESEEDYENIAVSCLLPHIYAGYFRRSENICLASYKSRCQQQQKSEQSFSNFLVHN